MKNVVCFLVLVFSSTLLYGDWTDPVQIATGSTNQTCTWNITATPSGNLDVVYYRDNVIYYRQSTDNGVSWSEEETLSTTVGWGKQQDPSIAVDRSGGRHAAWYWWWDFEHPDSSFLYYTRNLGSGWETPRVLVQQGRIYSRPSIVTDESLYVHILYADNSPRVYYLRSTDRGTDWEPAQQVSTSGGMNFDVKAAADAAGVIHAAWSRFCDISYRRSTDYGVTWQPEVYITTGTSGIQTSVACNLSGHVYVTYTDHAGAYCRRSTDYGASWESARTIFSATYPDQTSVACGSGGGVFMFSFSEYSESKDHGVTWFVPENIAGDHASIASSADSRFQHVVWHSSSNVMYRRNEPLGHVEDSGEEPGVPGGLRLLQNHPDPFTLRTRIRYSLHSDGRVLLKVYDLLGNEVKTLVNRQQNSGRHQVVWDGTDCRGKRVVSGVYCCRLIADEGVSTKKLLVLRQN